MPKTENQKIKMLRLLEILKSDSDEENPIASTEIIARLKDQGIECGRKSLYDDIRILNEYGYEVMCIKGRQNMYYISDRTFDIPELRILLDAVQSAAFIPKKKTLDLVYKISALAGSHRGELLKKNTVHFDTVKRGNDKIFYSIDAIDRAIASDKKITFWYFDIDIEGERIYRKEKERYVLSPVGLILANGFHYLVGYDERQKAFRNYRVDRMDNVNIEEENIVPADCIKNFDVYKDQNLAFGMYSGEVERVTLHAHNTLAEIIFDKFGSHIKLNKADENHFTVSVEIQISPVFLSWCVMFGDRLKILSPKKVEGELMNLIKSITKMYEES
ncbi:MAG: WYL domain-containing protein [Firmicutes bacterium]|nr:WYL domain-containing protein [Bacillota bacterium]